MRKATILLSFFVVIVCGVKAQTEITTVEQFKNMSLTGNYKLMADIDLDWSFSPIGGRFGSFNGTFDGNGHMIRITNINDDYEYRGLFARVGSEGVVKNLMVTGQIDSSPVGSRVGGIVGYNSGTIINCFSGVYINCSGVLNNQPRRQVGGGIAGVNTGTISYCVAADNMMGAAYCGGIGGIVGSNYSNTPGKIENCIYGGTKITLPTNSSSSSYYGMICGDADSDLWANNIKCCYYKTNDTFTGIGGGIADDSRCTPLTQDGFRTLVAEGGVYASTEYDVFRNTILMAVAPDRYMNLDTGEAAGYITFYNGDSDYSISDNVTIYTGVVNDSYFILSEIDGQIIPKGVPVIIKSENRYISLYKSYTEKTYNGTNDLKGTDSELSCTAKTSYILGTISGTPVFLQNNDTKIAANTAYIPSQENMENPGFLSLTMSGLSPSIAFIDANVKALCVANWDTNNDGELSEEEAAAVTDIETVFQNQTEITSFSEFKYFTGVTTIGQYALSGCTNLATIEFPSNLQSFDRYACYNSGFENIVIPENVTSIGNSAFRNCTALSTIKFGENSVSFGKNVFRSCTSLTSITFDGTECQFNGEDAFRDCNALTSVVITDVSAWCKSSFTYSSSNPLSKTKSLSLQTSDNNISVIKHLVIPDDITTINNNTFYLCESLESIVIPSGVTSIGGSAFYGCHGLTSVTIPNSVTTIGSYVFYGCSSLPSITIPNSVTAIGSYSFYACNSLTSITIPNSVTTIGNSAFAYCNSLTSITVERTIPVVINELTFSNRTNATLYVPAGSKAAYEAADYWKEFKEIVELPDGKLFFEGTTVRCGSQSAIPVLFESEAAYGSLQCEVTLPAGITLNKVSKTARLSDAFTLTKSLTGDNTYQILLYNTERATFAGNDGALFTMTVDVADNMAVGNYDVTLSNIVVSDVDNNQTDLRDCNVVLRVENYLLGDANRDNRVNVTDIMAVANKILKYDVPNFNEHAADVNFDNRINVTDIMGIANIILKINTAAHAPAVQLPEPQ